MRVAKVDEASKGEKQEDDCKIEIGEYNFNIKTKDLFFKIDANDEEKLWERYYKVYDNLVQFKDKILKYENIWAIYSFKKEVYEKYSKDPKRYEDIVCGFLEYYDLEVRNGMTNHIIYFYWGKWKEDRNCVVIFIDKPPRRAPEYSNEEGTVEVLLNVPSPIGQLSDPPKPPPPPPPPPY
jgi:hypothetical protein